MHTRSPSALAGAAARAPGSNGLWTFVFIDMIIFALMFFTFMAERLTHAGQYTEAQGKLNPLFGIANTLILLTSSWLVAEAVAASRRSAHALVSRNLAGALLLGMCFIASKSVEYYLKLSQGITPITHPFFSFYYFITAAHLMHLAAGMFCIAYCRRQAMAVGGPRHTQEGLENVGLFWHLVDVLWIFIFPMIYLIGRV